MKLVRRVLKTVRPLCRNAVRASTSATQPQARAAGCTDSGWGSLKSDNNCLCSWQSPICTEAELVMRSNSWKDNQNTSCAKSEDSNIICCCQCKNKSENQEDFWQREEQGFFVHHNESFNIDCSSNCSKFSDKEYDRYRETNQGHRREIGDGDEVGACHHWNREEGPMSKTLGGIATAYNDDQCDRHSESEQLKYQTILTLPGQFEEEGDREVEDSALRIWNQNNSV